MNTADYLLEVGEDQRIALVTQDSQYTYRDLKDASACLVNEMMSMGVQPFDRVGLLGGNSLFWVAAYLAILKLGAVAVPFSITLTPADLHSHERFVKCKVMCLEKRYYRKFVGALVDDLPLIFDDVLERPATTSWEGIPTPISDEQQDAALMFTSGTTARPRAVRVTHRNIQANADSIISYLDLTSAERIMAVLSFSYCFGTSLLHTHLRVGGSLVLSNSFAYPETVLDLMQASECTGFAGVPSTYQTLLRNSTFPRRKFETLRKVQQAGGKLPVVLIKELVAALPEAQIHIMYGQTEATARLSYLPPSLLATKLGSVGRGIPGVELRVIGDSGTEVKPGEVGEIIAKGDNIAHCRQHMARHLVPKDVVVESLPMNGHGKVVKSGLRKQAVIGL